MAEHPEFTAARSGRTTGSTGQDHAHPPTVDAQTPGEDAAHMLERLLTAPRVDAAWFAPAFLDQVPLARVEGIMRQIMRTHGAYRALDPIDQANGRFTARYARGGPVAVRIHLDGAGRIDGLLFTPQRTRLSRALTRLRERYPAAPLALILVLNAALIFDWSFSLWQASTRLDWLLYGVALVVYAAWAYATLPWWLVSSWLRPVLPVVLLAGAALSYPRAAALPWGPLHPIGNDGWTAAVALLLTLRLSQAIRGRRVTVKALNLSFPLRYGAYVVGHGGSTAPINYHVVDHSQKYALDVLKIDRAGRRARGLYPRDPRRYHIFDDVLYSPCDGTVVRAVDGLPDLDPPRSDPARAAGNHVLLEHDGTKILLAHLRQGSVAVADGARVRRGQPLGRVGNSGNTSEPHLHIHAERGGAPDVAGTGEAVPLLFDSRFLCRNDLVGARVVPGRLTPRRAPL